MVTLKRLPYPGTPLTVGTDSSAVLYYTLLLQRIAYYYDSVASPALSRQYTQETADATASAQELLGLLATGVADAETWTAVEALSLQLAAFTPNPDRHPEQGPDYPDRAMKEAAQGLTSASSRAGSMAAPSSTARRTTSPTTLSSARRIPPL